MRKNIEFVIFLKLLLKSERQCAILVSMLWSNDFLRRIFGYGSLESSAEMGGRRRCNAMKKQGFFVADLSGKRTECCFVFSPESRFVSGFYFFLADGHQIKILGGRNLLCWHH